MTFENFLSVLTVVALSLGYGACAALRVRNHRIADRLLISALGVAGSVLVATLGWAFAFNS